MLQARVLVVSAVDDIRAKMQKTIPSKDRNAEGFNIAAGGATGYTHIVDRNEDKLHEEANETHDKEAN